MATSLPDADPLPGGELAALLAAIESGSVQGAADALALTQSAATKRIQKLERRLGGELIERGRFGVRPTALGRAIYPHAKRALLALSETAQAAAEQAAARQLELSASLTIGEFLLPAWLAQFRAERPDVHPALEVVNSSAVLVALRNRRAAIGFVEGLDSLEGWDTITVGRDRLVVVVAAGHRWARRRSVRASELLAEPYLTREPHSGTRAIADSVLARAGIQLTPALQAASLQSLKRAIHGGGFTLISELTIEAEQRSGTLAGLPIRDLDLRRDLRAVRPMQGRRPEPANAFWRWLQRHSATN